MMVHCTTDERRSDVRYETNPGGHRVSLLIGSAVQEAVVRDISRRGIGLLVGQEVRPDQLLMMPVGDSARQRSHLKSMRVIHTMPTGDGRWSVGCSFLQPFTEDELGTILSGG